MFLHQPSGVYLTEYRAYDPYSGRWLSRDPAGEIGGINLYAYVGENPIDENDPYGLLWGFGGGGILTFGAEGGAGVVGGGGQYSYGRGAFANSNGNVSWGDFCSAGAFAGGPGYGPSSPPNDANGLNPNQKNWAVGGSFGGSAGGFLTNAPNVQALAGPFNNYNFTFGPISGQLGLSGGTFIASLSLGIGAGASASSYPTNTNAGSGNCGCSK